MNIITKPLGMIQANCYLVSSEKKNAFVVDPGGDADKIINLLEQEGLNLQMILLTHGHHDHIAAVWDLLAKKKVPVYIHEGDLEMLEDIKLALCSMAPVYFHYEEGCEYHALKDGEQLELDELTITVIHTPGHSKGSCCYAVNKQAMFTGDTLFNGDIGRCDLYGGSYPTMKESLAKLSDLEDNYDVYPGHGPATTLQAQKKQNPYMGQVSYDDYF